MKELYFENIDTIGNLYLDKVFNNFEGEDIVFICTDQDNNHYFCICYEFRYKLAWIITKVTIPDLVDVINKDTDMHSLFQKSDYIINIIDNGNTVQINQFKYEQLDLNYLPTKNVYLKEDTDLSVYLTNLISQFCTKNTFYYQQYFKYELKDLEVETFQNNNLEYSETFFEYSINQPETEEKDFSTIILKDAA